MKNSTFNDKLDVFLANHRGFCAGVERAVSMVEEAIKKYGSPIYVRHEIVHNKHVVEDLESKGAIFVEELDEIKNKNRPVIFSAHGVPKSVPLNAKKLNLTFYDATCPLVSKIHREVEYFENNKYPIILIGHRNHPEVIGTMGQIKSKIHLVQNIQDVYNLKIDPELTVAYVTQTTLSIDDTKEIISAIKKKYNKVIEPKKNDICYATTNRQEAVKEIASKCDLFIVIGASNSSNSLRLVEVAKQYGSKDSVLLENINKFNYDKLKNVDSLGLTASASAPEKLVTEFIDILKEKFKINLFENKSIKENIYFKIPYKLKS
tara:strand:+ start:6165 stop:7121 length:957 start_codon:yes stop_codon:yes gene_type:complete